MTVRRHPRSDKVRMVPLKAARVLREIRLVERVGMDGDLDSVRQRRKTGIDRRGGRPQSS